MPLEARLITSRQVIAAVAKARADPTSFLSTELNFSSLDI
jgi:hypothetical protein